ncbi:MAG: hypothetical protein L0Z48_06245 [candidate division Zixibacteria bacterium]|nr:hypothetical protein [candidate division Zixibacteria bacterium]MCI0596123.1 hypothetical protein [candidate division Zixibacteria bacterium]
MFKKWLAILAAVVLAACAVQLLWAAGGGGTVEEHPWGTNNNETGSTGSGTVQPTTGYPLTRICIVRPAPMGGFYLMWISLPAGASEKASAGAKKVEN